MAKPPQRRASSTEIQQFLQKSRAISTVVQRQPRLLFAIDATASRQPTWDTACHLQRQMFEATGGLASLSVQLCYFRGFNDFYASRWLANSDALGQIMSAVYCEGGHTQIRRLLRHALAEHRQKPIRALVFIGDAAEESADELSQLAGECGLRQLPLFLFHEGQDPVVAELFRRMARLSKGAYARFDSGSARTLAELLGAVASYASGGRKALQNCAGEGAKLLLQQLDR